MTRKAEVKWVLEHIIPYLVLKKGKAQEALKLLNDRTDHHSDGEFRFYEEAKFDHNYLERYWPKFAGGATSVRKGIRYEYGDLNDIIEELLQDPTTRQAVLPIFAFEDTGYRPGRRKPCSLFYQFQMNDRALDIVYYLRSCDFVRHFRDDLYLTVRLLLWVLAKLQDKNRHWYAIRPGKFVIMIGNLHCFANDAKELGL
jgi:thymidylate synthase